MTKSSYRRQVLRNAIFDRAMPGGLPIECLEDRRLFAAGDLDATFGSGGRATIQFPQATDAGNPDFVDRGVELFAMDSRNSLTVVAGNHRTGSFEAGPTFDVLELALARLAADGSLDPSFSGDGLLYSPVIRNVRDIYVQPDNGVLVLGTSPASEDAAVLARFTPAGELDLEFGGGDGLVEFDFDVANVDQTPDGKIVVSGAGEDATQMQLVLVASRLLSDGSLDSTFDDDGVAVTEFSFGSGAFLSVQPNNGKILLATSVVRQSTPPVEIDGSVIRLNLNGNPDSTFSGNGQAFVNSEQLDDVAGIDVGTNGEIYVALGDARPTKTVLTKLSAGGAQGALFEALDANALINNVEAAFDSSGKILLFGVIEVTPGANDFKDAIIRYNSDGSLDRTFGSSGKGYVFNEGEVGEAYGIFTGDLQADMKIVTARGDQTASGGYSVVVTRRLSAADGTSPPTVPPTVPPTSPPGVPPTSPPTVPPTSPPTVPPTSPPTVPPTVPPTSPPVVGGTPGTLSGALATTLPGTLISDQKIKGGRTVLSVTNPTTGQVKGRARYDIFISSDATIDGTDAAVTTKQQNLKLKAGETKKVKLPVKLLSVPTAGTYQLLVRITAPDQTTTDVAGDVTFPVAEPTIDLTTTLNQGLSGTVAAGSKAVVKVLVENTGNVRASAVLSTTVSASTDGTESNDDVVLATKTGKLTILPGKSKLVTLKFAVPQTLPAGAYFLTAKADAQNALVEPDENNNVAIAPTTFTVS